MSFSRMTRILYIAFAAALVLPALAAEPVLAQTAIFLQGESFNTSYDVAVDPPYAPIHGAVVSSTGILQGLDYEGEWASYDTTLPGFGDYTIMLRVWGEANVYYQLRIHVIPAEGEAQSFVVGFRGLGFAEGCS